MYKIIIVIKQQNGEFLFENDTLILYNTVTMPKLTAKQKVKPALK